MRADAHVKSGNLITAARTLTCGHNAHDNGLARGVILEQRATRVALATAAKLPTAFTAFGNVTSTQVLNRVDCRRRPGFFVGISAYAHRSDWDVDLENLAVDSTVGPDGFCVSITCDACDSAFFWPAGIVQNLHSLGVGDLVLESKEHEVVGMADNTIVVLVVDFEINDSDKVVRELCVFGSGSNTDESGIKHVFFEAMGGGEDPCWSDEGASAYG